MEFRIASGMAYIFLGYQVSIEYIKNHKHGPFILWISFPDPHTPFDCPEPWNRLHHPETVELPNQMNLDFEKGLVAQKV